jgi:hypothetical protein
MSKCPYCHDPFKIAETGGATFLKNDGTYWHCSHYREGAYQTYKQIHRCRECGRKLGDYDD